MRLLHTADLHLGRGGERSLDALDALLTAAEREEVDALTVGGDCFDSAAAADERRPELRERFTDNDFDVLVVPGNHDAAVFDGNVEFGPDFRALSTDPVEVATVGDGEVVGVADRERLGEDLYFDLRERAHEEAVLLLHCTLDAGFGTGATGDEAEPTHCPVQTETLGELGYEFVLSGHVHSELYQRKLPNGGLFIYPGSPVSHSWAETGRRHAVVVDTDDANVQPVALDTFYRDRFSATVAPGDAYDAIERVEGWVDGQETDRSDLEVRVDGFTELDESTFDERLHAAAGPATVLNETRGVAAVLDHPIYADFVDRLDELDLDEFDRVDDREAVEERLVETLAELLSAGEVTHA
ncbi:metallophosphoesterase family protein [Halosimplex pelagicum]|uniref:Metallophosphoesterase family protein n=1 Tax=Halosimplex pelagicum TaxID=869886 RepID=A0A7D5P4G9_9EURY|nr:metallophosphoesterase [Halosimplex pelagicum]QLH80646.1 metallophosphoesterase family protein [Halosimplex pelagicum]